MRDHKVKSDSKEILSAGTLSVSPSHRQFLHAFRLLPFASQSIPSVSRELSLSELERKSFVSSCLTSCHNDNNRPLRTHHASRYVRSVLTSFLHLTSLHFPYTTHALPFPYSHPSSWSVPVSLLTVSLTVASLRSVLRDE
eukprot:s425_g14.t1